MKNLQALFEHELKDLYSAEKQMSEALPKMVAAASNKKLHSAFSKHLDETKGQMQMMKNILDDMNVNPGSTKCDAMAGLIKECEGMLTEDAPHHVRDAGLIACAQRCEHYEISGYGTAKQYAITLGHNEIAKKLDNILDQEAKCNDDLNDLAIMEINKQAL